VIAAHKTGERWFEAELHRLQGEALLALCLIGIHPMFVSHF
jgi:predicted ATPase